MWSETLVNETLFLVLDGEVSGESMGSGGGSGSREIVSGSDGSGT